MEGRCQYYDDQLWKFQPEGEYILPHLQQTLSFCQDGVKVMVTGEHLRVVNMHWDLSLTGSISDNESFISVYTDEKLTYSGEKLTYTGLSSCVPGD